MVSELLYNLGIHLYTLGIRLASFSNEKAKKWIKGRKEIFSTIEQQVDPTSTYIWMHCASLGEYEQGRPVVEELKNRNSQLKCIITFFSPSGYEQVKGTREDDLVFYLPADTPGNAKKFIELTRPRIAIFVRYEFWKNYIDELDLKEIPTYLISASFRKEQIFFRFYGGVFRKLLSKFAHLFLINENSAQLLRNINIEQHSISGDTRIDRVIEISENENDHPIIRSFCENSIVLLCGSTWQKDEEMILKILEDEEFSALKLIIAPHHVGESSVNQLIKMAGDESIRYSSVNSIDKLQGRVLIIDCIGILAEIYRYAPMAYIGGGFGTSVHNILEAAVYKIPVIFGPNHKHITEALELNELKVSFPVNSYGEFRRILNKLIQMSDTEKNVLKSKLHTYFELGKGSTKKISDRISEDLQV